MTDGSVPHAPARTDQEQLRHQLLRLTAPSMLRVSMLMIVTDQAPPVVYDVPISADLAVELAEQCAASARSAAESELRNAEPGLSAAPHQWLYSPVTPEGRLAVIDALVTKPTHQQYDRTVQFGRKNLLGLRLRDGEGHELGRLYQSFSPDKALQRSKLWALWSGERFERLTEEPLILDRELRLIVVGAPVVLQSASTFQTMFGALPELKAQAAATYRASIGKLDIVDGDKLAKACETDLNMMRKLVSIQAKLDRPGYADAVTMPALVNFLKKHPEIEVPLRDADGPHPMLVFSSDAQHRWAILKLLDDDFLRSELTDITYETNSKIEL